MSTWEQRMSARAAARTDADQIRWVEEHADEIQAEIAAEAAEYAAGPPGGCLECFVWRRNHIPVTSVGRSESWCWYHVRADTADRCRHHCHDEQVWAGPVAYG